MNPHPSLATAAFLIADPARSAMLTHLLDGRARPAGELAWAAGVTAQTASAHLGKLLAGGLLAVEAEGRHRYYRLAGPQVALALEALAAIGPPARPKPLTRQARELRFARCCYDHLAGRLGVAVTGALEARGLLVPAPGKRYAVPDAGRAWFARMGVELDRLKPGRHGAARACLDWTEREPHLAGPLGTALLQSFCAQGWLRRSAASRAVRVTPGGWIGLKRALDLDPP